MAFGKQGSLERELRSNTHKRMEPRTLVARIMIMASLEKVVFHHSVHVVSGLHIFLTSQWSALDMYHGSGMGSVISLTTFTLTFNSRLP